MNWPTRIAEIRRAGFTYQAIADACGMSKGQVHDLGSGKVKDVLYCSGEKLVQMHKKALRKPAAMRAQRKTKAEV